MEIEPKWRQYVAAGTANLGILSIGICMGWTSPTLPILLDEDTTPLDQVITDKEGAWIGSLIALGAAVSPLYTGISTDVFGRKKTLLASGVPLVVGWVLVATAKDVGQLYAARVLWGLALGQIFTCVPMYVGEIAEDKVRGALGSFLQIFLVIGFLLVYSVGPYVSYLTLSIISTIPPLLFMILFSFMPESPSYLVKKGHHEEALLALQKLRGKSEDAVKAELANLRDSQINSSSSRASLRDMWTRGNIRAMYLTCGLLALQQFSGINVVQFYMQTIFAKTGTSMPPEISTIIIGIVQVIASSTTLFLVDRVGKRWLLKLSSIGMSVSLTLLGVFFILDLNGDPAVEYLSWLPVTALVIFTSVFCVGYGPLAWAVIGELLHPDIKYLGSSIATSFAWILAFLITNYFGDIEESIGMHYAFWIFAVISFCGFFFVQFLLPETKGKSLQEIQDILNSKNVF